MARTWAILGRVLHVPLLVPGDAPAGGKGEAEAEAERDAEAHGMAEVKAADAQAGGGLETLDKAATQQGADFSILLAEPPRITVMTVAPTAHLIHEYPDSHAYIVSVDSDCILLNFGVDPFKVAGFDDRPYQSNLIVVRDYNWAGVEQGHPITATAERIPPRSGGQPAVTNVESIGLIYSLDPEDYVIAELMIDKGCERAMFLYSYAGLRDWIQETTDNPLPLPERDREWIPSGVVSYKKMLWWFDLSWGIISSGPMLETAEPLLLFHRLPEGHDLNQAQRGMHDRRCIAVSRGCLRYVAITTDGDAATVSMWTRVPSALVNDGTVGWIWEKEFTVSFAEIWEHDCYAATRLPRKVPVLAAVSPSNANIVYFALADQKKRLFGVNMYSRAVEEFIDESYELLMPGRPDAPPSCRYVLPWFLPLEPRGSNSRERLPRQSAAAAARNAMSGGGQDLQLPPGFRFHPTDEELVVHYLCRRCAGLPIAVSIIAEIDLYKFDPWQLPRMALYGEKEWYFFSPRDRKYPNGSRPNRAAGSGYWKATGSDKPVGAPKPLAIKKALVFYAGKAPKGEKTNWIMHEYRLADVDRSARKNSKKNRLRRLDDWVLCRIYNKKGELEKPPVAGKPELAAAVSSPPEQKPFVALPAPGPGGLLPAFVPGLEAYYDRPSDSMPRLHADSSCSEQQALSPEQQQQLACDREVQSQPKISEWERTFASDPAGSLLDPVGDPLLQDILMYWDKPF